VAVSIAAQLIELKASDGMQKSAIKYLLTSPVNTTLAIESQQNSEDLPLS